MKVNEYLDAQIKDFFSKDIKVLQDGCVNFNDVSDVYNEK